MQAILVLVLATLLTACGAIGAPPRAVVQQAIAVQITQTQTALESQLYRQAAPATAFQIEDVKVTRRQSLAIASQPGYQIQGSYTMTLNFPERRVQKRNIAFEVYLQRQPTGKAWNLARPRPSEAELWNLQPLTDPSATS